MPFQPLDAAVAAFLDEHVASVEELEMLIRIVETPERWWDALSMSGEFGIPVSSARMALDALAARNLLDIRITADVRYQFRPGTPDLGNLVGAVVDAYHRTPAAVVQAVMRNGSRGIRDFANAFRIRRRDRR